ncbi:MAG: hypothetical protein AAGL08_05735 [Cyanobacteria bacterium J06573_11]
MFWYVFSVTGWLRHTSKSTLSLRATHVLVSIPSAAKRRGVSPLPRGDLPQATTFKAIYRNL